MQFCASTPIQHAVSVALQVAEEPYEGFPKYDLTSNSFSSAEFVFSYYQWLRLQFSNKREQLEEGLIAAGLEPIPSQGGFFLMARLPSYPSLVETHSSEPYDYRFCKYLAKEYGVLGIPASPFFSRSGKESVSPMARFAFCKKDKTIQEAARRLKHSSVLGVSKK